MWNMKIDDSALISIEEEGKEKGEGKEGRSWGSLLDSYKEKGRRRERVSDWEREWDWERRGPLPPPPAESRQQGVTHETDRVPVTSHDRCHHQPASATALPLSLSLSLSLSVSLYVALSLCVFPSMSLFSVSVYLCVSVFLCISFCVSLSVSLHVSVSLVPLCVSRFV